MDREKLCGEYVREMKRKTEGARGESWGSFQGGFERGPCERLSTLYPSANESVVLGLISQWTKGASSDTTREHLDAGSEEGCDMKWRWRWTQICGSRD